MSVNFRTQNDPDYGRIEDAWKSITNQAPPLVQYQGKQRSWNDVIVKQIADQLLSYASTNEDKARLLAVRQPHAGD